MTQRRADGGHMNSTLPKSIDMIEHGEFYRTEDGLKIGPMTKEGGLRKGQFSAELNGALRFWRADGTSIDGDAPDLAERWTDGA